MSPARWGRAVAVFIATALLMASSCSFQTGAPSALFDVPDYYLQPFHPQFAPTRDGKGFLMRRRQAGTDLGVVVVFNFLDDLRRRMAAR